MPKIEMDEGNAIGGTAFKFSSVKMGDLGATEYTLVNIAVDATGSVAGFVPELVSMLQMAVDSCKKSPRAENLLVRVILFSTTYAGGISELHGFKLLKDIDPQADYQAFRVGGGTPLLDAIFSSVGASNEFGKKLFDQDYLVNAITFVITDGEENSSRIGAKMVMDEISKGVGGEYLESSSVVLVGINASSCAASLDNLKNQLGITQFVDAGNATPQRMAKLAGYVSKSVSSTANVLGTGGPSKISATI